MSARRFVVQGAIGVLMAAALWAIHLGLHWWRTPYPVLLHERHAEDLTNYARRVLAGEVGTQPDPRNGLLLDPCMVGYDVNIVTCQHGCVLIGFHLPWFDGPIYRLIYQPPAATVPSDERDAKQWHIFDDRDFGDGWRFISKDVLEAPR